MKTYDLTQSGSAELQQDVLLEIMSGRCLFTSLLDLCCGEMTVVRHITPYFQSTLAIDVQDREHRPRSVAFVQADVLEILPAIVNRFQVAFCGDGLEHFRKDDGRTLLRLMESAARLPIIFTPLGDVDVHPRATDPDAHKSGWLPEELEALGWETLTFPNWHAALNCGAFFAWKEQA
jgi:hypothetical protein